MTAVSPEGIAASTEIGSTTEHLQAHSVYTNTVTKLLEIAQNNFIHARDNGHGIAWMTPSFVWEYCAVSVSGPRQSGKTSAVVALVQKFDVAVSYNTSTAAELERRVNNWFPISHDEGKPRVLTSLDLTETIAQHPAKVVDGGLSVFPKAKRIFFDDASMIFARRVSRRLLAEWLVKQYGLNPPMLILVG